MQLLQAGISQYLEDKQTEYRSTLSLKRFEDTHLYGYFENGRPAGGRITYVRLFSVAALLILLIASINFVNLATAWGAKRAKEVRIRKAAGASRQMLAGQFMAEAMFTVLFSFGLALLLVELAFPLLSSLTG